MTEDREVEFKPVVIDLRDTLLLESRRFVISEICRTFGAGAVDLPPPNSNDEDVA